MHSHKLGTFLFAFLNMLQLIVPNYTSLYIAISSIACSRLFLSLRESSRKALYLRWDLSPHIVVEEEITSPRNSVSDAAERAIVINGGAMMGTAEVDIIEEIPMVDVAGEVPMPT